VFGLNFVALIRIFCEGEQTMSEFAGKSASDEREEEKLDTRSEEKRLTGLTVFVIVVTLLAVLVAVAVAQDNESSSAQDKYSLKSPSGIAFSDFRGYEDWPAVSSARQDEILKVIVANPKMIAAYKAGVPRQRPAFPGGLHDREAPVEAEEEHGGPVRRGCARRLYPGFRHGKGQQEISETGGWGYAVFNYDAASGKFTADPKASPTAETLAIRP
jgi:hypothetical protein